MAAVGWEQRGLERLSTADAHRLQSWCAAVSRAAAVCPYHPPGAERCRQRLPLLAILKPSVPCAAPDVGMPDMGSTAPRATSLRYSRSASAKPWTGWSESDGGWVPGEASALQCGQQVPTKNGLPPPAACGPASGLQTNAQPTLLAPKANSPPSSRRVLSSLSRTCAVRDTLLGLLHSWARPFLMSCGRRERQQGQWEQESCGRRE